MFPSRTGIRLSAVLLLTVLLVSCAAIPAGAEGPTQLPATIDAARADQGVVSVNHQPTSGQRLKVTVENGNARYTYNYDRPASFPLQAGSGTYTVRLLENIGGNSYRVLNSATFTATIASRNSVFLQSIQLADYRADQAAVAKARVLTQDSKDDLAKVKSVYNYVLANFTFDTDKLAKLTTDYIPSVDRFWQDESGICYDFASLLAAMLRSAGVPTKLIKGYTDNVKGYHAWNEVLVSGKWQIIDSSFDAQMHEAGRKVDMFKDAAQYNKASEY